MIENYSKKLKEELKKSEEMSEELEFYRENFGNLEQVIQDVQIKLEFQLKEKETLVGKNQNLEKSLIEEN